jgi:cytoskeletal protein RodZ
MVHSVGQKLKQARLAKNITVEQAAHATKIRAERIKDLEVDDFTNFPNLTYAKGFLVIYAKYLSVDVSDFAGNFAGTSSVGVEDYEYLRKAEPRPGITTRPEPKTSPWPVLFGLGLAFLVIIGVFILPKLWQIGDLGTVNKPTPAPTAAPASTPTAVVAATPTPTPVARAVAVESATPTPVPTATPESTIEVRRAEPVNPLPPATGAVSPAAIPSTQNILTLQSIKKTWVLIRRGGQDAPPVYEDWLTPDAQPLTFNGPKFWIQMSDPNGVQIRKNSQPVTYQQPGISVE